MSVCLLNILETRTLMQGFGKNDGSFCKSFKVEENVASNILRDLEINLL